MEYFCVDHPPDRLILCHRSTCDGVADYLEVSEEGDEYFVCAAHTSSERYVFRSVEEGCPRCRTAEEICCVILHASNCPANRSRMGMARVQP